MRRRLLKLEPDALERRRKESERRADVRAYATSDGMGVLSADLPVHGAVACREMVDALATMLRADGDERPIGVLRGVALMDLVLRPEADRPAVTVPLTVHAWVPSLRRPEGDDDGADQEPGEVGGHVVSAAQCRDILTELGALGVQRPPGGSLHVALHDPATGDLVAVATPRELERAAFGRRTRRRPRDGGTATASAPTDRPTDGPTDGPGLRPPPATTAYRPTAAQRRHVRVRDRRCRAFGCARPAEACDADHVHPHAEGGATDCLNLCSLCRRHHRVKTHGRGWRYESLPDGRLRVTTPSGVTRTLEHPARAHADPPDASGPGSGERHPHDPASR
jgi:hypothetical protein